MTPTDYDDLINAKLRVNKACGFEPMEIHAPLFEWQKIVVRWAIRQGRAALFEECGLGKTLQQIEWARQVAIYTQNPVLILCPLAVAEQTVNEGKKFGIPITHARDASEVVNGVNITNYERLHLFEDVFFSGVVLDESSILKSFNGKTRQLLTQRFARVNYRLCCTATPSPNDFTELGQHADFLGICSPAVMLATYFINDTFDTGTWRLKGHSEETFWRWVSSWAACISTPSDLGFEDAGYVLPPLTTEVITVAVDHRAGGGDELFHMPNTSATNLHREMRRTMTERVAAAAKIVNGTTEQFIVWTESNEESAELAKAIPDAVEVAGSDSADYKSAALKCFAGYGDENDWKLITKRGKLAIWQDPDTSRNTTEQTETSDSLSPSLTAKTILSSAKNISGNTTRKTKSLERQSSNQSITLLAENDTPTIPSIESASKPRSKRGGLESQLSRSPNVCASLESPLQNLTRCSNLRMENAPSADTPTHQKPTSSLSLTTAIQQEKSEDYSAPPVISESENSETIPSCCDQPSDTSRRVRVLISKPSIFGFGCNMQFCHNDIYVGMTHSFERFYQAGKRIHRFGQKMPVKRYIVQADTENGVMTAIMRKQSQHDTMRKLMQFTRESLAGKSTITHMKTDITSKIGDNWTLYHGDCVRVARTLKEDSIGFSVFSPPFADLFTYSSDIQDMGNCADMDGFMQQFEFLVDELLRITMPGRECAVHCCDLLATKWKDGDIEFKDFSGTIARCFRERGWLLHSRVCIWKDPVTEMQRTKAHGLLYKTLRTDSSKSRVGSADYLLVFRKPGINTKPITHNVDSLPLDRWQELASPVWMTVDQGRVLNGRMATEDKDERHICPLQLDVIERALTLWSAPDDLVFSPFTGIGSEGYCALQMGRRFIGAELKESYFHSACSNLANATQQQVLFSTI